MRSGNNRHLSMAHENSYAQLRDRKIWKNCRKLSGELGAMSASRKPATRKGDLHILRIQFHSIIRVSIRVRGRWGHDEEVFG